MLEALIAAFETIEDPRCAWKVEHRLLDILVIAVCAVLGEAESFEDIALYGRCKRAWLGGFLELPNGIPSHDTFRRVFMLIDPEAFERCVLVRPAIRVIAQHRGPPPLQPGDQLVDPLARHVGRQRLVQAGVADRTVSPAPDQQTPEFGRAPGGHLPLGLVRDRHGPSASAGTATPL